MVTDDHRWTSDLTPPMPALWGAAMGVTMMIGGHEELVGALDAGLRRGCKRVPHGDFRLVVRRTHISVTVCCARQHYREGLPLTIMSWLSERTQPASHVEAVGRSQ